MERETAEEGGVGGGLEEKMKAGVERKRNLKRRKWTEWRVMERKQILGTAQR